MLDHVVPGSESTGEADGLRVALGGSPVDDGPAGVRQPEQPGHLVVRLARSVVDGGADLDDVGGDGTHLEQRGVATGDQQCAARHGQLTVLQQVDGDVARQVVDAIERLAEVGGEGLGRRQSDDESPHESRSGGDGDAVQLGKIDAGRGACGLQNWHHRLQVGTRCHLWHHSAEPHVLLHGGGDLVGQQLGAAHDADSGLVARRLDSQDERFRHDSPHVRSCRSARPDVMSRSTRAVDVRRSPAVGACRPAVAAELAGWCASSAAQEA